VTRLPFLLLPLFLASCGDLPQPFAGRPGATALRLSAPPPARLTVPPPAEALLPQTQAVHMAQALSDALVANELPAFAQAAQPGDWQVRMTATLSGITVQPHYAVLDAAGHSRGDIAGAPIPASAWQQADPATLHQAATEAAPRITDLMRAVDAASKQSDPNSLYNRPAGIYLAGVTGAPGDGNESLTREMRRHMPETGDLLVKNPRDADFTVHGVVKVTDEPANQQQIEIHWIITDTAGKEAGDVAQGHDFPHGALDRFWGDVAVAVAQEAAGGVHEVITNWSGRKNKPAPGGKAPAA
jgi:hypothetical protein